MQKVIFVSAIISYPEKMFTRPVALWHGGVVEHDQSRVLLFQELLVDVEIQTCHKFGTDKWVKFSLR